MGSRGPRFIQYKPVPLLVSHLMAEFIGTFFLVLAVSLCLQQTGTIGFFAPIGIGFMFCSLVFSFAYLSSAVMNPAVGLSFWLLELIGTVKAVLYAVTHVIAALAAAFFGWFLMGQGEDLWAPQPRTDKAVDIVRACMAEFVFTFGLLTMVLHVACSRQRDNQHYGLGLGFFIASSALCVGSVSGGAFNPALATATQVVACVAKDCTAIKYLWIYWIFPPLGASAATFVFALMHPVEVEDSDDDDDDDEKDEDFEMEEMEEEEEYENAVEGCPSHVPFAGDLRFPHHDDDDHHADGTTTTTTSHSNLRRTTNTNDATHFKGHPSLAPDAAAAAAAEWQWRKRNNNRISQQSVGAESLVTLGTKQCLSAATSMADLSHSGSVRIGGYIFHRPPSSSASSPAPRHQFQRVGGQQLNNNALAEANADSGFTGGGGGGGGEVSTAPSANPSSVDRRKAEGITTAGAGSEKEGASTDHQQRVNTTAAPQLFSILPSSSLHLDPSSPIINFAPTNSNDGDGGGYGPTTEGDASVFAAANTAVFRGTTNDRPAAAAAAGGGEGGGGGNGNAIPPSYAFTSGASMSLMSAGRSRGGAMYSTGDSRGRSGGGNNNISNTNVPAINLNGLGGINGEQAKVARRRSFAQSFQNILHSEEMAAAAREASGGRLARPISKPSVSLSLPLSFAPPAHSRTASLAVTPRRRQQRQQQYTQHYFGSAPPPASLAGGVAPQQEWGVSSPSHPYPQQEQGGSNSNANAPYASDDRGDDTRGRAMSEAGGSTARGRRSLSYGVHSPVPMPMPMPTYGGHHARAASYADTTAGAMFQRQRSLQQQQQQFHPYADGRRYPAATTPNNTSSYNYGYGGGGRSIRAPNANQNYFSSAKPQPQPKSKPKRNDGSGMPFTVVSTWGDSVVLDGRTPRGTTPRLQHHQQRAAPNANNNNSSTNMNTFTGGGTAMVAASSTAAASSSAGGVVPAESVPQSFEQLPELYRRLYADEQRRRAEAMQRRPLPRFADGKVRQRTARCEDGDGGEGGGGGGVFDPTSPKSGREPFFAAGASSIGGGGGGDEGRIEDSVIETFYEDGQLVTRRCPAPAPPASSVSLNSGAVIAATTRGGGGGAQNNNNNNNGYSPSTPPPQGAASGDILLFSSTGAFPPMPYSSHAESTGMGPTARNGGPPPPRFSGPGGTMIITNAVGAALPALSPPPLTSTDDGGEGADDAPPLAATVAGGIGGRPGAGEGGANGQPSPTSSEEAASGDDGSPPLRPRPEGDDASAEGPHPPNSQSLRPLLAGTLPPDLYGGDAGVASFLSPFQNNTTNGGGVAAVGGGDPRAVCILSGAARLDKNGGVVMPSLPPPRPPRPAGAAALPPPTSDAPPAPPPPMAPVPPVALVPMRGAGGLAPAGGRALDSLTSLDT